MGFLAPSAPAVVVRYGGDLLGLEVTVRRAQGPALRAAARAAELSESPEITEEDGRIILDLFEAFARNLIDWNLERLVDPNDPAGPREPVPATPEGIADQDDAFMIQVVMGWLSTVSSLGRDTLEATQISADRQLAASLPVAPLDDELAAEPDA